MLPPPTSHQGFVQHSLTFFIILTSFTNHFILIETSGPKWPMVIPPSLFSSATAYTVGEFDICNKLRPEVFTLIYVHTAPAHFKLRSFIRRTFGSSSLYRTLKTVTLFFIGQSEDRNVDSALRAEIERYHDIIQGAYIDSYRNLSLKAISTLKWVKDNCLRAKYVFKVDDDVFVNIYSLVRHLQYLSKYEEQSKTQPGPLLNASNGPAMHCALWPTGVHRSPESKWYVSREDYPEDDYPMYCNGVAFFMESAVVPVLFDAVNVTPFYWIDDVYATGLMVKAASVRHNEIKSVFVFDTREYGKLIDGEAVFGYIAGDECTDLRYKYWKKVQEVDGFAVV